jgi:poly(A) polymerase
VALDEAQRHDGREKFVQLALADTDRRVGEGKPVAPSFMLACMLWHDVLDGWQKLKAKGESSFPALQQAIDTVFDARIGDISGRGKLAADMREIWQMQPRFERRQGNTAMALLEQPRFRAGFDFLRLRGDAGEIDAELANWWEDFSLADDEGRRKLLDAVRPSGGAVRRVRSSAPKAAGSETEVRSTGVHTDDDGDADEPAEAAREGDPVRKRRRRRRKPAAAGGGGDTSGSESAADVAPVPNPGHDV